MGSNTLRIAGEWPAPRLNHSRVTHQHPGVAPHLARRHQHPLRVQGQRRDVVVMPAEEALRTAAGVGAERGGGAATTIVHVERRRRAALRHHGGGGDEAHVEPRIKWMET